MNDQPDELVVIKNLKLASWLILRGERLIRRELQENRTAIHYFFHPSHAMDALVAQWEYKTAYEINLSRFANVVTSEIRIAARLRRDTKPKAPEHAIN